MKLTPLILALAQVDPTNESHWTSDGQVRVDLINAMLPDHCDAVTRQDIIDQAPAFMRDTAEAFAAQVKAAVAASEETRDKAAQAGHQQAAPPTPNNTPKAETLPLAPLPASLEAALALPLAELYGSAEKLQLVIDEVNARCSALVHLRQRIDAEMAALALRAEVCSRHLDRVRPPADPASGIQAYLRQSAASREARRQRAIAFTQAGTSAREVAETLAGPSKLDAAMARRTGFGNKRPAPRQPTSIREGA